MDMRYSNPVLPAAADLATAPAFALGPISVEPSLRCVGNGDRSAVLEPRVMRVLVALGGEPGRVFSRDELIELCWDGVVVGDKAINRVISLLRHALSDIGGDAVGLETITKVGFRLVVKDGAAVSAPGAGAPPISEQPQPNMQAAPRVPIWRRKWTRRAAAGAVLATGAGAGLAYAGWWGRPRHNSPDPRALDLYRRGQVTQRTSLPGTMRMAMGYYKQAVEIDPDYADAWAALAIGYRHGGDGFIKGPRTAYPRLVREAAGRALAIDPDNAEAQMALVSVYPNFRRWFEQEANFRAIVRRHPGYWYGNAQLGLILQDVGRFEEAIAYARRNLEIDPMLPRGWANLARALHYAGRDQEAEIALDKASARWRAHPDLWTMRYHVLIGGKRYTEAAAFARDPRSLPEMIPEEMADALARTADALASRQGIAAIVAGMHARPTNIDALPFTVPLMAELGDTSGALDRLEAYFLGGSIDGRLVPPPDLLDTRLTVLLFAPAILVLRNDPRYAALLKRTGLEDYWRKSGKQPDFRKG